MKANTMLGLLLGLFLTTTSVKAFVPPAHRRMARDSTTSSLGGISEWRDIDFALPGKDRQLGVNTAPPKSVCLLPFPFPEVLLQGETKQLRLYEERFIKLFQDVMDNHEGVVAMGLLADSGIIQTVPLCEVEASNTMEGFGIFVTIRVVGRAQLLEITQQEPYLRGVCMEIIDEVPPNLELPNMVASNIEHCMELLSNMDKRLGDARKNKEIEDDEMDRRIALAKLVSLRLFPRFYNAAFRCRIIICILPNTHSISLGVSGGSFLYGRGRRG